MSRVVIGMDPHKRSATIEAIDEREKALAQGRFSTDTEGYQQMLAAGRAFNDRVWAVEGCSGIGRHPRILREPEMSERLAQLGLDPAPSSPEEMAGFLAREQERYAQIIKAANIHIE